MIAETWVGSGEQSGMRTARDCLETLRVPKGKYVRNNKNARATWETPKL